MSSLKETGLLGKIEELYRLTRAISQERDFTKIIEMTLMAAKRLTNADGGSLYTLTPDKSLKFEIMMTDSLGIHLGGTSGEKIPFAPLPLYFGNIANIHHVACYSLINDTVVNIEDAYRAENFDFSGTREFDRQTGYRSVSFLSIPLRDHARQSVGVMQLINAVDAETGEVRPFNALEQKFGEFLASQAAITMANKRLIEDQEKLFFAFADVIASAIDDKSPHTGEHCKRVPIITMMLADAADKSRDGIFSDFKLLEDDKKQLHLASILHDCGKITTPVHVIEKARKLQTIYDRIETIDTRFEVLKRDVEINYLRKKIAKLQGKLGEKYKESKDDHDYEEMSQLMKALNDDRDFLRKCNIGGEYMAKEFQERVRAIGKYKWINPDGVEDFFLSFDEIHNLVIERGTLTDEERETINRHIDVTIMMLNKLPFPKHLERIPEYAGGHHERMDGKGRPRGLTRDQMSIQARLMGVAEIFEALTARERPYKKGKTLSESLKIMGYMVKDGHIDGDIFNLLVDSGVYLDYAKKYVAPAQIDDVDLTQIPCYSGKFAQKKAS